MTFQLGASIKNTICIRRILYNQVNCDKFRYAMFAPDHQKPIPIKKLKELDESDEILAEFKLKRILPPLTSTSSSVFHDDVYELMVNYLLHDGKKMICRKLMEKTFYEIKKTQLKKYHAAEEEEDRSKIECNPFTIFHTAIRNCQPLLTVEPLKRGARVYQVPIPLEERKARMMSMKWIREVARDKELREHLPGRLAKELIDAFNYEGRVIKKKQDLHKLCEANRAYTYFRRQ